MPIKKIHVIVNPAAGHDEAILNTLNRVFAEYDREWHVAVTHVAGDAERLAREALERGAELVAGYGGDGTLMEIVNGLRGSEVPLGVLPGGTGNSLARRLGIPSNLRQAAELLCRSPATRQIDLGRIGDQLFMLHAYTGLEPSQRVGRDLKNSVGIFAYVLQTLRVLTHQQLTRYFLTVDGQELEHEGIVCLIINALSVGIDAAIANTIKFDDGLLDLILVKQATLAALPHLLDANISEELFEHWPGREISVRCETVQHVWIDGEPCGETPFDVVVAPKALRVVVPQAGEPEG
ncbi:MAG TPA: diacylglycerol kinase family protein [Candidatus Binatia bacterium]|nr:diacylglycerol kinase family protein [Candidatus Binatia bacterium]